jgi:hypothetical protein
VTAEDDLAGAAGRAAAVVWLLLDGEDHLAVLKVGADVVIASDAEGMVQQTRGHVDLLLLESFDTTPSGVNVSTIFNPGARLFRMNLNEGCP